MRKLLDLVYGLSGAAAALSLLAICLLVIAQVIGRIIETVAVAITGEQLGLVIPSAAEFAGFFLAGASFLALAYTLRHGGHIRVSLLVQRFHGGLRRWIEIWCLGFATLLAGFFAWHTVLLVLDSWEYEEVSYGLIPVPLWIPQTFMAAGIAIFAIALADDLVRVLRGADTSYQRTTSNDELFAE
jgi:TRAP-type C4-dicarboxylate transport system permease small subunit